MRIELLTDLANSHDRPKRAGDVVDFPAATASRFVSAGIARLADEPEIAVRSASVERAVKRGRRR